MYVSRVVVDYFCGRPLGRLWKECRGNNKINASFFFWINFNLPLIVLSVVVGRKAAYMFKYYERSISRLPIAVIEVVSHHANTFASIKLPSVLFTPTNRNTRTKTHKHYSIRLAPRSRPVPASPLRRAGQRIMPGNRILHDKSCQTV